MKNFIKTKDGIYEVTDWLEDGACWCLNNGGEYFPKCEIKAEADSPEELCDEMVMVKTDNPKITKPFIIDKYDTDFIKECNKRGYIIKGGIWTDEGLIYVFKINKNGSFDLICN